MRTIAGSIIVLSGAILWGAATLCSRSEQSFFAFIGGLFLVSLGIMFALAGFIRDQPLGR